MKASRSDLLRNIALAVISTSVLLLGIEMVLRVTGMVPARTLEYVTPGMWDEIPGPLWPNQSFTDRFKKQLPYSVSTNSLGFRGPEVPREKTPGVVRVVCLGDSYTYGAYVNDHETWPYQLGEVLNGGIAGRPVEVINAGISGFTIEDELAFLEEHGLDLEPDVVVLAFVLNDLADLTREISSREMLRLSVEENAASPVGPLKRVLRQTAIYNALFLLKAGYRKSRGTDATLQHVDIRHLLKQEYDAETLRLFDMYEERLARMKSLLEERDVPLVLMIFPYWEQVAGDAPTEAQRRLAEMGAALDVPVLDLLPDYRRLDPAGEEFFHMPFDHHPSASGYTAAADTLAPRLVPLITGQASLR